MKPCTPQSWSSRRLTLGGSVLLCAWLVGAVLTGSGFIGVAVPAALIAADWLWLRFDRRLRPERFAVACRLSVRSEGDGLLPGGVVDLCAQIRVEDRRWVLVLPVVPASVTAVQPLAARGVLRPGAAAHVRFAFRVLRGGRPVFPGILIRAASPLGIFARSVLVTDRQVATVLPDYQLSTDPLVARFLRARRPSEVSRRHVMRGIGTNFHELRPYQAGDVQRRVDWKATARRGRLFVREFEEPREFTVRILLDGSADMLRGGDGTEFASASDLIAKLALVCVDHGMGMSLTVYDDVLLEEVALGRGTLGLQRLMTALIELPGRSWHRPAAAANGRSMIDRAARRSFERLRRRWTVTGAGERMDEFLARYLPDDPPGRRRLVFLGDFDPGGAPGSGDEVGIADEAAPRAGCAAALLSRGLRAARGREMLLFISSLRGGEVSPEVAGALRVAAAGHRTVHVLLPRGRKLEDSRPDHPGSFGHHPQRQRVTTDLHRLHLAARFMAFRRELEDAGVHIHWIDDRSALDGVVASLLEAEVLGSARRV